MALLPLETARRVAIAALSSLDVSLRLRPQSMAPMYSWVYVTISTRHRLGDVRRRTRESLRVLAALAACRGYALTENRSFWSELWPVDPAWQQQQPQWTAKWKDLRLQGRPMPSSDTLRFLFRTEDVELGDRAQSGASAVVEDLFLGRDAEELDSVGFRHTMAMLSKHIESSRWPLSVKCGVECRQGDLNRWNRVWSALQTRSDQSCHLSDKMNNSHIPLQLTECCLSVQHCLERSGLLRDVAAALEPQAVRVPVSELKLHFGWNYTGRNLDKRIREFRLLMWNMAHDRRSIDAASLDPDMKTTAGDGSGVRALHLIGRCLDNASFISAFCSAIPFTQSLKEVCIVLPPLLRNETRALLWRWLAVSVFHPQSCSKVQHLDLSSCNISLEDVEAVCEALKKDWSNATLSLIMNGPSYSEYQVPSFTKSTSTVALVKSNARIEAEPVRRLFSRPLTTLKHAQMFSVICLLEEWICVHAPGFGCGFIKGESVVSITERSREPYSIRPSLTSLKLKTVSVHSTLALLRAIGCQLERLDLDCVGFTNAHLNKLLASCPELTHLTIRSGKLDDFSALVYALGVGTCKIESLQVLTRQVATSSLEKLSATLSDPILANACSLRELRLQTGFLTRADLEILLAMLQSNRTLWCLRIKIAFDLFDEFMPRFLSHRCDWLRGGEEERRKLAFVSALSSYSAEDRARKKIDSAMLERILEFAREGEREISMEEEYTDRMAIRDVMVRANAA